MTLLVKAPAKSNYTDAEITEALLKLAMNSGAVRRTERETGIAEATLRGWRDAHHEDYKRIVDEQLPTIYANVAEKCEGLALEQAEVEAQILSHLQATITEMKPDQAASALRNVAVSKAVNIDKSSLIRGRPSEIRIELGVEDLVRAIGKEFGPALPRAIDSSADEIHPSPRTHAHPNAQAQDARPSAPHATAQD